MAKREEKARMRESARSSKGFLSLKSKKAEDLMRQSMTSFKSTQNTDKKEMERDPGEFADGAEGGELCPFKSCGRKFVSI